jgi:hypothetical protein
MNVAVFLKCPDYDSVPSLQMFQSNTSVVVTFERIRSNCDRLRDSSDSIKIMTGISATCWLSSFYQSLLVLRWNIFLSSINRFKLLSNSQTFIWRYIRLNSFFSSLTSNFFFFHFSSRIHFSNFIMQSQSYPTYLWSRGGFPGMLELRYIIGIHARNKCKNLLWSRQTWLLGLSYYDHHWIFVCSSNWSLIWLIDWLLCCHLFCSITHSFLHSFTSLYSWSRIVSRSGRTKLFVSLADHCSEIQWYWHHSCEFECIICSDFESFKDFMSHISNCERILLMLKPLPWNNSSHSSSTLSQQGCESDHPFEIIQFWLFRTDGLLLFVFILFCWQLEQHTEQLGLIQFNIRMVGICVNPGIRSGWNFPTAEFRIQSWFIELLRYERASCSLMNQPTKCWNPVSDQCNIKIEVGQITKWKCERPESRMTWRSSRVSIGTVHFKVNLCFWGYLSKRCAIHDFLFTSQSSWRTSSILDQMSLLNLKEHDKTATNWPDSFNSRQHTFGKGDAKKQISDNIGCQIPLDFRGYCQVFFALEIIKRNIQIMNLVFKKIERCFSSRFIRIMIPKICSIHVSSYLRDFKSFISPTLQCSDDLTIHKTPNHLYFWEKSHLLVYSCRMTGIVVSLPMISLTCKSQNVKSRVIRCRSSHFKICLSLEISDWLSMTSHQLPDHHPAWIEWGEGNQIHWNDDC